MMSLMLMNHRCGRAGTRSVSRPSRFLAWRLRSRLFTQHSPACAGREKQEQHFTGSMGPASAKTLNSHFMAFISASTGIPQGQMDPCGPIPFQPWAVVCSFHAALGHLHVPAPCCSLSSNLLQLRFLPLPPLTVSHFIVCRAV